jgi:hypothetical protein
MSASETWRKEYALDLGYTKSSYGGRYWMVWQGERLVASQIAVEADADTILADHNATEQLAVAVQALEDIAFVLEFGPDEVDYILEGFDGHKFDKAAAGKGMEMGCITCCQIDGLRDLRAAIIKAFPLVRDALSRIAELKGVTP